MTTNPIKEGEIYCLRYGTLYRNPYPPGTVEHNQFERGWSQTIKKHPNEVANIDKKRLLNDDSQKKSRQDKTLAEIYAYKNAKGK